MTLKYERQWEIIEKICDEQEKKIDLFSVTNFLKYKKAVIENIFGVKWIDWEKFWFQYESLYYSLQLYDWEHQQKPLLDKLIEVVIWNHKNNGEL